MKTFLIVMGVFLALIFVSLEMYRMYRKGYEEGFDDGYNDAVHEAMEKLK